MKTCKWCDTEYEAKRSTSRFCSNKCKQMNKRHHLDYKPVSVSEEPIEHTFTVSSDTVRDSVSDTVRATPEREPVKQQSYNPMMVGYVPPKE